MGYIQYFGCFYITCVLPLSQLASPPPTYPFPIDICIRASFMFWYKNPSFALDTTSTASALSRPELHDLRQWQHLRWATILDMLRAQRRPPERAPVVAYQACQTAASWKWRYTGGTGGRGGVQTSPADQSADITRRGEGNEEGEDNGVKGEELWRCVDEQAPVLPRERRRDLASPGGEARGNREKKCS